MKLTQTGTEVTGHLGHPKVVSTISALGGYKKEQSVAPL